MMRFSTWPCEAVAEGGGGNRGGGVKAKSSGEEINRMEEPGFQLGH